MLVILCGLPAAGKSTLTSRICEKLSSTFGFRTVCFDDSLEQLVSASVEGAFSSEVWHESRARSYQQVHEALLSKPTAERREVIVVDDNMHYRSMRKPLLRLALDARAAVLVVHVWAPVSVCIARNATRTGSARVDEGIIRRMHERLQTPCPAGAACRVSAADGGGGSAGSEGASDGDARAADSVKHGDTFEWHVRAEQACSICVCTADAAASRDSRSAAGGGHSDSADAAAELLLARLTDERTWTPLAELCPPRHGSKAVSEADAAAARAQTAASALHFVDLVLRSCVAEVVANGAFSQRTAAAAAQESRSSSSSAPENAASEGSAIPDKKARAAAANAARRAALAALRPRVRALLAMLDDGDGHDEHDDKAGSHASHVEAGAVGDTSTSRGEPGASAADAAAGVPAASGGAGSAIFPSSATAASAAAAAPAPASAAAAHEHEHGLSAGAKAALTDLARSAFAAHLGVAATASAAVGARR